MSGYQVSSDKRRYKITLRRVIAPELFEKLWIRKFDCESDRVPEWFSPGLQYARPALGYGVIDPIELRLQETRMLLISTGNGRTLAEYLKEYFTPKGETYVRSLTEQLCYGVLRIHEGQGRIHGALTPSNICTDDDYRLSLWAVPTARLELSVRRSDEFWERPFRSPTVHQGATPKIADDIYSLGALFMRLLCGNHANFVKWLECPSETLGTTAQGVGIANRCLHEDPEQRYPSAKALALDLDPTSRMSTLDITGAKEDTKLAIRAFQQREFESSLEHWQDACQKDWLDQATHNNIGVTKGALGHWEEALHDLEKARKIGTTHPLIDTNLGLCYLRLKSLANGEYWLRRALALNPSFHQPSRLLAAQAHASNKPEKALYWIQKALRASPKERATRVLAANILESAGQVPEASAHRRFARNLIEVHPLQDHLLTADSPLPWTLYLAGQDEGILQRLEVMDEETIHPHRLKNLDRIFEAMERLRRADGSAAFSPRLVFCDEMHRCMERFLEPDELP
jgi:tetratricopeptide (TPR) repeat protein